MPLVLTNRCCIEVIIPPSNRYIVGFREVEKRGGISTAGMPKLHRRECNDGYRTLHPQGTKSWVLKGTPEIREEKPGKRTEEHVQE